MMRWTTPQGTIDALCGHYSIECLDAIFRKSEPSRLHFCGDTVGPPACQPSAGQVHPATGRKSLFMSPEVISHFDGMAREASLDLVDALTTHALQPKFQYRHVWHAGDLLIWDNHFTMHRATAFDAERYERLFLRTMIDDDAGKGVNGTRTIDKNIWLAEGPIIDFYGFAYPTRTVIVRLEGGALCVWSPVELTPGLKKDVDVLGDVSHLVSPNKIHHSSFRVELRLSESSTVGSAVDDHQTRRTLFSGAA